jgi:hypothetical protein
MVVEETGFEDLGFEGVVGATTVDHVVGEPLERVPVEEEGRVIPSLGVVPKQKPLGIQGIGIDGAFPN